jgi:hypothetical protein
MLNLQLKIVPFTKKQDNPQLPATAYFFFLNPYYQNSSPASPTWDSGQRNHGGHAALPFH